MKVTDRLKQNRKAHLSFEISPPPFGKGRERAFEIFDKLMECTPDFVSITFHPEIVKYVPARDDPNKREMVVEKPKAGTLPLCSLLEGHYDTSVVQHLLCGGFSRNETAFALKEMAYVNLDNAFALRGDPIIAHGQKKFEPFENGHRFASELVAQISAFNRGEYRDDKGVLENIKTDFCIGVAGYPEKHYEAPNMNYDLIKLKEKVDKGAHYIITQMFYDNRKYFDFVGKAREIGINVPIIPGLNPILALEDINALPRVFHLTIPQKLVEKVSACSSSAEIREAGLDWLVMQAEELLKSDVPDLHFFTEGRDSKIKIAKEVYKRIYG